MEIAAARLTVRYSFALATSMCRARRESGTLIYLLGSHNCARVTHFTSAFHLTLDIGIYKECCTIKHMIPSRVSINASTFSDAKYYGSSELHTKIQQDVYLCRAGGVGPAFWLSRYTHAH